MRGPILFILINMLSLAWISQIHAQARQKVPTQTQKESVRRSPQNAQKQNKSRNLKALVTVEEAFVYEKPDFDSQIVGAAKNGQVYEVSQGKKGAFHKIRLKPGFVGWISEIDFKVITASEALEIKKSASVRKKKSVSKNLSPDEKSEGTKIKRQKAFNETPMWGPMIHWASFTENTMGAKRSDSVLFFGAKMSGPGTLFLDDTYTDASVGLSWGAPGYYKKVTQRSAEGWIFLADYLYIIDFPQSSKLMSFFGLGPMFRYSHFSVSQQQSGTTADLSYSLDDMTLGAVASGGIAYRISHYAIRLDGKYHWEKQQYFGAGLTFQFEYD